MHEKISRPDMLDTEVKDWLDESNTHQKWIDAFRNPQNSRFYESAFDIIAKALKAPNGAMILDVGCGSCIQSIRLARRGFNVLSVDNSNAALELARENVTKAGLTNKIRIERQDLCSMSFDDETFDYAICWGVLMHIPKVEEAITELVRVIRPGGIIVISEGNDRSLDSIILKTAKPLLHRQKGVTTPAGIVYFNKESGEFLRSVKITWLVHEFQELGCTLVEHRAGQFSIFYTIVRYGLIYKLIQWLNTLWFNRIKNPYFASGNILIFKKKDG